MKLFIKPTEYGCVIKLKKEKYFNKGIIEHKKLPKTYSFAVPSNTPVREGDEVIYDEPIQGDLRFSVELTGKDCE